MLLKSSTFVQAPARTVEGPQQQLRMMETAALSTGIAMTNALPAMATWGEGSEAGQNIDPDSTEAYNRKILNATAICLTFAVFLVGLVVSQARKLVENSCPTPTVAIDIRETRFGVKGDCFGFSTGGWRGLVPFEDLAGPASLLSGAGAVWAFGQRIANLGGFEAALATGTALRRYAVRVFLGPWRLAPFRAFGKQAADAQLVDFQGTACTGDLSVANCPSQEPSRLDGASSMIDWRRALQRLCECTSSEAMVGEAAATAGACCDLDVLDQALSAMGHPKGVLCLHGALAVLASCSARLSLRHRPRLSHRLASPSLRKSLVRPRLMHLASPVILRAAPGSGKEASARVAQHLRDAEWWDLQVVSMLSDEPGITRTYRVRGSASDANFAPFPFGSQDLLWWRSEPSKDELRLLLQEVVLGLSMAGIRDFAAFVGTVCLMADESQHGGPFKDSCNAAPVPDMVVPWEHREATAAYARNWRSAEPGRRHLVLLPGRLELGLLPDPGLLATWPDGFSFEIACPNCPFLQLKFFREAPGHVSQLVISDEAFVCLWPKSLLMPLRWIREEELRFGDRPHADSRTGQVLLEDPATVWELPWPAEPRSLVEYRSPRDAEVWCDEARQVFSGGRQSISLAPEFDLSADVSSSSGFYDLFDLRKFSTKEGLALLLDKTALKKRLVELQLPALVPVFSTTTPDLPWEKLRELSQYAIKAAHKHHGGLGVLLMSHGRDLLTGRHMDEVEVVRWAAKAFEKEEQPSAPRCWDECTSTSAECETRCVTNAPVADDSVKQGLLVEELAVTWDGRSGLLPDEAFCFVAWGRLSFFGVMAAGGTWLSYFASDGTPIFARPMKAQKHIEAGGAFRTGLPWGHELRSAVVSLAERAAQALGADFLRIDIFPNGGAPLISEVSIVTGWFGRENLRWGEVDAWLLETLRDQWISGYALSADI
ncbi:unnamed protein product [Symbiodinium sp. CCMP2456]|nr:unnamed protein product [Symbiodinium sp. CCMP2456]